MTENILSITKRLAARREIEGAIRLLSDHHNYIGAELLASAAIDVLGGLARAHNLSTLSRQFEERVKPEALGEFRKIVRKPYNFLKHSDRDRDTAIDRYDTKSALWRTFIATTDYECCFSARTLPMMFYSAWFFSCNPNVLKNDPDKYIGVFNRSYGDLSKVSHSSSMGVLKTIFEHYDQSEKHLMAAQFPGASVTLEV